MSNFQEEQLCDELAKLMEFGKSDDGVYSVEDLDPNTVIDDHGTTLLHLAVKYDKISMTQHLIRSKCNVDAQDHNGDTPLILALYNYRLQQAQLLINADANICITNNLGESALGIMFGKKGFNFHLLVNVVKEKIRFGCITDENLAILLLRCHCPLHQAVHFGRPRMIEIMIKKGCEINAVDSVSGATALHIAASLCYLETVKILLHHRADINAIDRRGSIPFDNSLIHNSIDGSKIMKLLMPENINWTERCFLNNGRLKLYWIFTKGSKLALELFLRKYSINFNVKDSDGNTPLHYLVKNLRLNDLELFRHKDLDVNAINNSGEIALHIAIKDGVPIDTLRFLLDKGADLNAESKDYDNSTPLLCLSNHLRVEIEQNREIIALLLKFGADVNKPVRHWGTLLHYLVHRKNMKAVELLQDAKFDVNALNQFGRTPLFVAAKEGNSNAVKWLLRKGANVNVVCPVEHTPIFTVYSRKSNELERLECVTLLLIYGAQLTFKDRLTYHDVDKTVIDVAEKNGVLSLLSPVLVHLAILQELEQSIDRRILVRINEIAQLRSEFDEYKQWLKKARTVVIGKNVSLFRLLTDSPKAITNYEKPSILFKDALVAYRANLNVYLKFTLEHRYDLAKKVDQLRETASHVINESIGFFDSTHIVVKKIVSFLQYADLEIFS